MKQMGFSEFSPFSVQKLSRQLTTTLFLKKRSRFERRVEEQIRISSKELWLFYLILWKIWDLSRLLKSWKFALHDKLDLIDFLRTSFTFTLKNRSTSLTWTFILEPSMFWMKSSILKILSFGSIICSLGSTKELSI